MPLSPLLHRLLPRSATGACVRRFAAALSLLLLPLHAPAQSPATRAALMSSASPGSLTHGSPEVQRLLTDACRSGSHTAAEQALALGASANDKDSPLTLAAERNDLGLVELLIQYGADASREPAALPAALRHKNAALASSLLNAGADPNLPDAKGATPLSAALTSGDMELARLMFRHGGYPDEFIEPAMQHGDLALLTALFQYGILPDRTDQSGNPLLVRAALDNKPEIAAFLLQAGALIPK